MSWLDRTVGIVLGIALGLGIVTVFVFEFSEDAVDAPSLSVQERDEGGGDREPGGSATAKPVTVRIVGGAPPASGPAQLDYVQGDRVRIRIVSDAATSLELAAYGLTFTVPVGPPTLIEFEASRDGNFPLIVSSSHIAVAQIRVTPRS